MASFQINWRRGLLRAWVLLTAIWVVFVSIMTWNALQTPYVGRYAFVEDQGEVAWDFTSSVFTAARRAAADGALTEFEVEGAPGVTYFTNDTGQEVATTMETLGPVIRNFYEWKKQEQRPGFIAVGLATAIVPSIALLLFGALAGWVISGFFSPRARGT